MARLHALGVEKSSYLFSDNEHGTFNMQRKSASTRCARRLLPNKVRRSSWSPTDVVAMIGDSVGMTPTMARAHFIPSPPWAQSDVHIKTDSPDDGRPSPFAWLIGHSRHEHRHGGTSASLATRRIRRTLRVQAPATMWGAIADVSVSLLVVPTA
jgi:hypothetical protein